MKYFLHILLLLLSITSPIAYAEEQTISDNSKPPLAIRGADIKEVSRIVFDGIPKNDYQAVPFNNELRIVFENFQYSFLEQDLLSIGLLKNIKKLSVKEKNDKTILSIQYSCACQGDFYKWYNNKLVLDVFSLEAVANPLKKKQAQKLSNNADTIKDEKIIEKPSKNTSKKSKENVLEKQDFETRLKNIVQKATEKGLVQYKDSIKKEIQLKQEENVKQSSENIDDVAKLIENNMHNAEFSESAAPEKNAISNQNKPQKQDMTQQEKLLPTDKMFNNNKTVCLPDSSFKLKQNNPEFDNFYDKVSDYRNDLVGEFDTINPESALELANHYISYGLGEEALQVLSNFSVPEQRGYIAKSMARLLTDYHLDDKSIFKNADDCPGTQALWTAYRYYKIGNQKKAAQLANFSHAAELLKTFPHILQIKIGTSLALNLVRQNDDSAALKIIDTIANNIGQFNASVLLVRGLIDAKNGLQDRALKVLQDVVEKTQGLDKQMAGLALAELKLASNIELTHGDISTLEEIVFLKGRELVGTQSLALIAENESRYHNFMAAFERLSQKRYHNTQIKDPAIIKAEQLFKRIAVSGEGNDNPNTLSVYWLYPKLIPQDPIYLHAFAKKLFSKGYDYAASDVIDKIENKFPKYSQEHNIPLLKAQAFYRQGLYNKTINALKLTDNQSNEYYYIKAKALHELGLYQEAVDLLSPLKDEKSNILKAKIALLNGDWLNTKNNYESLKTLSQKPEVYYQTKAAAYMAGHQYPGNANQYKNAEDVAFHQPQNQAKNIDDVVNETKKIIELFEKRSNKIHTILRNKKTDNSFRILDTQTVNHG